MYDRSNQRQQRFVWHLWQLCIHSLYPLACCASKHASMQSVSCQPVIPAGTVSTDIPVQKMIARTLCGAAHASEREHGPASSAAGATSTASGRKGRLVVRGRRRDRVKRERNGRGSVRHDTGARGAASLKGSRGAAANDTTTTTMGSGGASAE